MDQSPNDQILFSSGALIAGRYEVVEHLGSGGMGTVVKAIDRTLDNECVALKFLYPHLTRDPVVFARFRNEVLVARKLTHPNIVRIFDFGRSEQGYYFISMEWIEGKSLRGRIHDRTKGRLTFPEILQILYDIADAVAHAHRHGVIHRDLKPDNVLINQRGEVKVTDFGLARMLDVDKGLTETGNAVGTPQYMSPEQIRGEPPDVRSDVYALGILAYELIVGQPPFNEESWFDLASRHLREPVPEFATKENAIPYWYEELVHRAAEKDMADRYPSAEVFAAVIAEHLKDADPKISRTPAVLSLYAKGNRRRYKSKAKRRARWRRTVTSIVVVAALTVGIGFLRTKNPITRALVGGVLRIEHAAGTELPLVKSFFGVTFSVTPEDYFMQMKQGNTDAAFAIIAGGLDPNAANAEGYSALHQAVLSENPEVARKLVAKGAKLEAADSAGMTPLMHAVTSRNVELVYALLENNPALNARDKSGMTALMHAAAKNNMVAAQALLDKGAYVNVRDEKSLSALSHAVKADSVQVAQLLLDRNAEVDPQDREGQTPLMLSARAGNRPLVQLLLNRGSDPSKRTLHGKRALDFVSSRNRDMVRELSAIRNPGAIPGDQAPLGVAPTKRPGAMLAAEHPAGQPSESSSAPEVNDQLTRLRFVSPPEGTWEMSRGVRTLTAVRFTMRNVGEVAANDISVAVVLPGGKRASLTGPTTIERNSLAEYSAKGLAEVVTEKGLIKPEITCSNCRK